MYIYNSRRWEYVYLGRMLNMFRDLDAEILRGIRSEWKAKMDKTLSANIFYSTVLSAML